LAIENKNKVKILKQKHAEFESLRSSKVAMITWVIEISFFTMRSVIPYGL
jgi:hypothetical protein